MNDQDPRMVLHSMKQSQGMQPRGAIRFLASIAENEKWRDLIDENGKPLTSFRQFLELPYPEGCGIPVSHALKIIEVPVLGEEVSQEARDKWNAKRAVIRDALTEALGDVGRPSENTEKGYNITLNTQASERGTSADYTLRRLKRDNPALAEKVIQGELSANAAAIKAGFRERSTNISYDPEKAVKKLRHMFDQETLYWIASQLLDDGSKS